VPSADGLSNAVQSRGVNMLKYLALASTAVVLVGCANDASVVSQNLSQAADSFQINRRIIFYNGITDAYMLTIEGLCSQSHEAKKLTVTCKTGKDETGKDKYKKHFLGLSDNVTYFSEQLEPAKANEYHYKVIFKPSIIIPSIEMR
jgi:hypothetical protein